jgi:hypothetical protein
MRHLVAYLHTHRAAIIELILILVFFILLVCVPAYIIMWPQITHIFTQRH